MTIDTKYAIGDRIEVMLDGAKHVGKIGEIRVLVKHDLPEPVITYAGKIGMKHRTADGKEHVLWREWIGSYDDILTNKHKENN